MSFELLLCFSDCLHRLYDMLWLFTCALLFVTLVLFQVVQLPSNQCVSYDAKREEVGKVLQINEATVNLRHACIACGHYIRNTPPGPAV
eukprot:m.142615 g.142615  ORF g.142615 m.142615 type:complete len:89 (-) comp15998_c1_seq2:209-475(-)